MSTAETDRGSESNQHYLEVALFWLRLRLERLALHHHMPQIPRTEPAQQKHGFLGGHPTNEPSTVSNPMAALDEQLAHHSAEMHTAETQDEALPLMILSKRLGLSRFERDILFLCVAMELDTRIAALCAEAQGEPERPYPTFALARALFDNPSWEVLSPNRPLRYWRLLEINQPNAEPLTTSPLRADERIVNYVQGLNYLDDRLSTLIVPLEIDENHAVLPPSQEAVVKAIVQHWRRSATMLPLIQLLGPDAQSKQLIAYHASALLSRHLYRIPVEMLPQQPSELELLSRLWHRESLLLPLTLYLDAQESDGVASGEGHTHALSRFLARSEGIFFLGTREAWLHVGRVNISLDVDMPTTAEQRAAWIAALGKAAQPGGEAEESPTQLASQFHLNLTSITHIAQSVLEEEEDQDQREARSQHSLAEQLWDACRMSIRPRLDMLAQRLELKATWEDLVLPPQEEHMLRQLADQVGKRGKVYEEWGFADKMNRGLGINALFAGESGTGKTMAAEVIAHELRLSLYRIDLSAVVSKFIGETEKNLRRIFDAAEAGGALLFFDEADALFGKRSEVKDSHDRYANIEINYLLQRIEAYSGLAILATNLKSALDTAFIRRLRFVVTFPFPGLEERKRMWERVFPPATPIENLDYDWLARLSVTGGSIHNIALNAAFMAAQVGSAVTMDVLQVAAQNEFRKLERPVNELYYKTPNTQGERR